MLCKIKECNREHCARGYCSAHYQRWYKGHPINAPFRSHIKNNKCKLDDCEGTHDAKGYCGKHYQKWIKCGDPNLIMVPNRGTRRHVSKNGYVYLHMPNHPMAYEGNKYVMEHRMIMSDHIGRPLLDHETVHHKNGNKSDNRIENLELWSSMHPRGKRTEDLVNYANEILGIYGETMWEDYLESTLEYDL